MVSKGNHPQMGLSEISEILYIICPEPICWDHHNPWGESLSTWTRIFSGTHMLLVVVIFPLPHHAPLDFPGRIPTSPISSAFSGRYFPLPHPCAIRFPRSNGLNYPQILSHLLLVVAIFHWPCAIRFPRSNRQIITNPISSAFSGRYSAFSHFTLFSCCVSRNIYPLCLPGEAFATAHRPHLSEQWSCGGEQFQAPPRTITMERHNGCHCIYQIKSLNRPEILSHLLFRGRYFFPCRTHAPLDFPAPIPTSPISSAFSGRYFSLAAPVWSRLPKSIREISTNPISSAISGRYFSLAAPICHYISQVISSYPYKSYIICY